MTEAPQGATHHPEELGWWRKYIFSVDHKVIGIQYTLTGLTFLFFGFCLMMVMRWQLAFPGVALPVIGTLFGESRMPGGIMLPEFYNQLGAMHGTIMVFLGVVPLGVGGFGNYLVPLQIGAPDMAFPRLNMASYWFLFLGGVTMFLSFFVPGGSAQSGWTSYPPLAVISEGNGQTLWLVGMVFLITSSLLGSINTLTTIIQLRAKGLTFMRLPYFVWAQFVTGVLLLLAMPPLEVAGILQLMDRVAGTSFFLPDRAGRERPGPGRERRRQPGALSAPVLVPGPPRGVRAAAAGHGHRLRSDRQQHPAATLGLPGAGGLGAVPGLHVLHRLGTPHVSDGNGDHDLDLLPDHHHDHLRSVGGDPDGADPDAPRRLDPLQHPHALRPGLRADVRHRRAHGAATRPQPPPTSPFTTPTTSSGTSTTWWRPARSSPCSPASITGTRKSPAAG